MRRLMSVLAPSVRTVCPVRHPARLHQRGGRAVAATIHPVFRERRATPACCPSRESAAETGGPAAVPQPRQRGDAVVAASARRVSRTGRRLQQFGLRRRPRRCLLPVAGSTDRDRHRDRCWPPGPGAGRARRRQERRPDRRAVQSAVRSATWRSPTSAARQRRWRCGLGRQELAFGEQRLVGHASWLNAARTFDAARVTLRTARVQIDVFAASVVRILADEFDKSGNGNRFAGAYATSGRAGAEAPPSSRTSSGAATPTCARESGSFGVARPGHDRRRAGRQAAGAPRLRRRDGCAARLARARFGARLGGTLAAARVARRPGHAAGRPPNTTSPRATTNPADGTRGTFDQLYPTAARQVRAGRSGRLAQHPPRARRPRAHAVQGDADHRQLSLLVARRDARRPLRRERRAARARRRPAPPAAMSARRSTSRSHAPLTPQLQLAGGLRPHLSRRVPEAGDAGRVLQLARSSMVDLRVPGGEMSEHDDQDDRRTFLKAAGATSAGGLLWRAAAGLGRRRLCATTRPETHDGAVRHHRADRLRADRHGARARLLQEVRHRRRSSRRKRRGRSSATSCRIGENQATHMLIGMPLASTMGLAGSPVKPMVIPWLLNRNGQAITLNNKLKAGRRRRRRRRSSRSPTRPRPPASR